APARRAPAAPRETEEPMSVRLMVEVLDHAPREVPDVQHRALIAVAERLNDRTRTGFHPLDELAHRISRSRPTATRTLRALTERGMLERSEEHTSELQSRFDLVCSLLPEKNNTTSANRDTPSTA